MEVRNQDGVDIPVLVRLTGNVAVMEMGDPGPQDRVGEQADTVHLKQDCSVTNIGEMGGIIHRC